MRRKRKETVSGFLQKLLTSSPGMSADELQRRALAKFGERKAITNVFNRTIWNAKKALEPKDGIQKASGATQRPRKRRRKRAVCSKNAPKTRYFLIRKRCSSLKRVTEDLYNSEKYIARAGFTFAGKVSEAKQLFKAGELPATFINDPKLRTRLIQNGAPTPPQPMGREMPTPEERQRVLACARGLLRKKRMAKQWKR